MNKISLLACVAALLGLATPALAQTGGINLRSSEYRVFGNLPTEGTPARTPWVGYWFAYSANGIASDYAHTGQSPAEKHDRALGRGDRLDMEALRTHIEQLGDTVHPLQNERRDLVQKINRMISRNEDYRDCSAFTAHDGADAACVRAAETTCECPWNRYRELDVLIREANATLPAVEIDTATEFEHMSHGNGVAGVQGWWGHCNAWAAAAILEPEPVRSADIDGVTWRVGDAKALLTEAYMDVNSAFYGSRVGENHSTLSGEPARRVRELVAQGKRDDTIRTTIRSEFADSNETDVSEYLEWFRAWNDVTPADFHILFTVYLGQLRRSFVIDRFTGDEVWNQPVSKFTSRVVRELERTEEGNYPILIEATFEWATDGVRPDETNASVGASGFHERTVSYTLYLDKPLSDANARIVGSGKWEHAASPGDHAHPDFIWVPTSDAPARPRQDGSYYENRFVDLAWVHANLLPRMTGEEPPPGPGPGPEPTGELSKTQTPAAPITDNATTTDALTLTGTGTIRGVQVELAITHSYAGDLTVTLRHGDRAKEIYAGRGRGTGSIAASVTTDAFDGMDAGGEWTLEVVDDANLDEGTLDSWTVTVLTGAASGG